MLGRILVVLVSEAGWFLELTWTVVPDRKYTRPSQPF
jgi:hypothetical protein